MHGRRPATAPDSPQQTLASRLSREMIAAERQGFGTSTVWLTRQETDLICEALRMAAGSDALRLDFLDRCAAAMTARDGAVRSWRMSIDQDSLMLDALPETRRPVTAPSGHASCRDAIDERIDELDSARAVSDDDRPLRERRLNDATKRA